MSVLQPGRCRHCGRGGECCGLANGERCVLRDDGVCTGADCLRAEAARLLAEREERRKLREQRPLQFADLAARGWGRGAIVEYLAAAARHPDWTHRAILDRLRKRERKAQKKRRAA